MPTLIYALLGKDDEGKFTRPPRHLQYLRQHFDSNDAEVRNKYEDVLHKQSRGGLNDGYPSTDWQWIPHTEGGWVVYQTHHPNFRHRQLPPWANDFPAIENHFAYLDHSVDPNTGSNMIVVRFFQNMEKGMRDQQTAMKPGRYLTKYFPHLTPEEVNRYVCICDPPAEVFFAGDGPTMALLYQKGTHSCMSYGAGHFRSKQHPVEAYAAGDLQLAYLTSTAITDIKDKNFRVRARALVWPEKKIYGRIYGDMGRLRPALEKLGYKNNELTGAKILHIHPKSHPGTILMPYIDNQGYVYHPDNQEDQGKFLIIGKGNIRAGEARSTTGIVRYYPIPKMVKCPITGKKFDESQGVMIADLGVRVSRAAVEDTSKIRYCAYSQRYFTVKAPGHDYSNGRRWVASQTLAEQGLFLCPKTTQIRTRNQVYILADTKETVDKRWAQENAHYDSNRNRWFLKKPDDTVVVEKKKKTSKPLVVEMPSEVFRQEDVSMDRPTFPWVPVPTPPQRESAPTPQQEFRVIFSQL